VEGTASDRVRAHEETTLTTGADPRAATAARLRRITALLDQRATEFAAAEGLHPTDLRALVLLLDARRDGQVVTPGWLSSRLSLNSASVTALVDRLVKGGFARRDPDRRDRRRVLITLRERGLAAGTRYLGTTSELLAAAVRGVDPAELRAALRLLDRVEQALASPGAARPRR
jgi:DNA-binding MarR family transcriptional regulator